MERLNSGDKKEYLRNHLRILSTGLMICGRVRWRQAEATRRDFRTLQGHSGRNLIFTSLQNNVLIPDDFFEYIYHLECAVNVHSIINSELIAGGQKFRQGKTDSILYGCESYGQGTQRS